MKSGDVAHEIIEAVARNLARGVEVNTVELFHDIGVVGYLEFGYKRLAEALDLNVLAVVLADGYGRVDDLRNAHHDLCYLRAELGFLLLKLRKKLRLLCDLFLDSHGFFLLALTHQHTDLL